MSATIDAMLTMRPPPAAIIARTTYLREHERRQRVEPHERSISASRIVASRPLGADGGVVDEPVDRPELLADALHESADAGDVGEIEGAEVKIAACRMPP